MKKIVVLAFVFLMSSYLTGQTNHLFEVKELFVSDSTQYKTIKDFKKLDSVFFEDEKYSVRKTCSGEWGGSIWFKNKISGIEYCCSATCAVIVNKFNGKYIVTSTLAHMVGFSNVIEISNPDSMSIFKLPEPVKKKGKMKMYYIGDLESGSKKGTNQLLDSLGVLTVGCFPLDGELYYVVTDFQTTFIAKIVDKKFVNIEQISNESIWTYDPEFIQTKDGHYILFFKNEDARGYLDVYTNKINLVRYK